MNGGRIANFGVEIKVFEMNAFSDWLASHLHFVLVAMWPRLTAT